MGFKLGTDCGTGTAIVNRPGSRILRDVHKREVVASGSYWANTPWLDASFGDRAYCATADFGHFLDSATRHRSERRHIGFPAKTHKSPVTRG
jgi:hypothetical protein